MTFLEYRDFKNIEDSFHCLLINTPGTKIDKQDFFEKKGLFVEGKSDVEYGDKIQVTGKVQAETQNILEK